MRTAIRIMLAGVGGQGTLLAAKVVSQAASSAGKEVKMAEIHGMSQRGGSVISQVSIGSTIHAPVHGHGTVDYLVAFEKLEAYRTLPWLKRAGTLILNTREISPMPVLIGTEAYPEALEQWISEASAQIITLDAHAEAKKLGSQQAENMILIGALSTREELSALPWEETIAQSVKPRYREINLAAFTRGRMLAGN